MEVTEKAGTSRALLFRFRSPKLGRLPDETRLRLLLLHLQLLSSVVMELMSCKRERLLFERLEATRTRAQEHKSTRAQEHKEQQVLSMTNPAFT